MSEPDNQHHPPAQLHSPAPAAGGSAAHGPLLDLPQSLAMIVAGLALLAGAVWEVYGRGIHYPFVFDDRSSVVENPSIRRLWPLVGDAETPGPLAPPKDLVTAGRPLVNLTLALNYRFGELDPTSYHLFNVLIHLLSAILLWCIVNHTLRLERFGGRYAEVADLLSWLVALLWAVHPLQTEAVEYVTQRSELLMGLFYLAALYGSMRYLTATTPRERAPWLAVAVAACSLGTTCKEVTVSVPVIVLLYDRTLIAGSFRRALRDSWPLYLGLGLTWLLLLVLNYYGPRSGSAGFHLGINALSWWCIQARVLLMYLKLAVWPWPLVIHYEMPFDETIGHAWPWVVPVVMLGVLTCVLLRRRSVWGFLGAWIFIILSPTLVVPISTEVAAERRMYLPLAALVAGVVVGSYYVLQRAGGSPARDDAGAAARWPIVATTVGTLLVTAIFTVVSINRLAAYQDPLTLWQDAVLHEPENAVVRTNLGAELNNAGRYPEAIEELEHAARIAPKSAEVRHRLGHILANAGRLPEAIDELQESLRIMPDNPQVHNLLGATLVNAGRGAEAIPEFEAALERFPNLAELHRHLGVALSQAGRPNDAVVQFEEAVRLAPDDIDIRAGLALAYAKVGRAEEAIAAGESAYALAVAAGQTERARELQTWLKEQREAAAKPSAEPAAPPTEQRP